MSNYTLKLIKPFGPTLGMTDMPDNLAKKINDYVDEVIKDEKKSSALDHGALLAGEVTQEVRLPKEMVEGDLLNFYSVLTRTYIKNSIQKEITKFNLIATWIVRQFQNEYNPIHYHGGHISGVGYLKVPKNLGETFQKNKNRNNNGNINLIHGSKQFLSEAIFRIKPEIGNFYFFPNYLLHTVYPFYNETEERRSISFNATIDDETYDVYG